MAAAEGIPTTDPSNPSEIVGVATDADEVPVLRSPPPCDDEDLRSQPVESSVEDLRAKIIKQVEYYFSDENLPNDKFLLKQMKKDKDGFGTCDRPRCLDVSPGAPKSLVAASSFLVSISLIGSFRKMKRLTKDISSILDALKESSQLVVSSDGKKVKRRNPLPSNEDSELCTVVVANLPEDHSVQNIQNICGRAGSIRTISIHDPHAAEDSVKRNKAEKLVNGKIYALVEYETVEAAEKAVATLNDETDWRNGLRVQHLQKRKGNGLGRKVWRESNSEKGGLAQVHVSAKDDGKSHSNVQHDDLDDEDGDHRSKEGNGRKGRNRSKGRKYLGNNGMGHGMATTIESSNKPPPGPRMPDGTRGFTMGRGRLPMSCHI